MFLAKSEEAFEDGFFTVSEDDDDVNGCDFEENVPDNVVHVEHVRMFGSDNGKSGDEGEDHDGEFVFKLMGECDEDDLDTTERPSLKE